MARKVILDVDPGIDDAAALAWALFDPRLEVVAVTAVAGNVNADQATRNVQTIVEQLDPPRWPRIGAASPPEQGSSTDATHLHGADGLGNCDFPVSELQHLHPSERVIIDVIRSSPDEVTLLALGPLTNVARAIQRDPASTMQLGELVMCGGSLGGIGDVTAAAEFNMHSDPASARVVFSSPLTKTLVPLDVTQQVIFGYEFLDALPSESTRTGAFLRRILPFTYRAYRHVLGQEAIRLKDVVALAALLHPEFFRTEAMHGDVETVGELTLGATVFDRRQPLHSQPNMEVAIGVQPDAVYDAMVAALAAQSRTE